MLVYDGNIINNEISQGDWKIATELLQMQIWAYFQCYYSIKNFKKHKIFGTKISDFQIQVRFFQLPWQISLMTTLPLQTYTILD